MSQEKAESNRSHKESVDTLDVKPIEGLGKQQSKEIMAKARYVPTKMINSEEKEGQKIYLFALTGGPCAGKTTSLQF